MQISCVFSSASLKYLLVFTLNSIVMKPRVKRYIQRRKKQNKTKKPTVLRKAVIEYNTTPEIISSSRYQKLCFSATFSKLYLLILSSVKQISE